MTMPREDRLVRLYVQLGEMAKGSEMVNPADVTPELILEHAQRIYHPYKLNFKICDWHSVYTVLRARNHAKRRPSIDFHRLAND